MSALSDDPDDPRPSVIRLGELEWRLVKAGNALEVTRIDSGVPTLQSVDTGIYCYRLTCGCGRERYAKRNSVHQVFACRVCTRQGRLQKRRHG
jgi:hypothetical protein